jgi:uncharacterized protein YjdB
MRTIVRRARLGALGVACLMAAGCPGCNPTELLNVTGVQSVNVAPALVQLTVGQTQQFAASVRPERSDQAVTWSVAPASAATIDAKGLLTALAPGQAVVRATTVATPTHTAEAAVGISAAGPQ